MRVTMIGAGYVGLVSGACFADFGHQVTCIDKDAGKVAALNRGEIPIFEPGLDALVAANVKAKRLDFTTDLTAPVAEARMPWAVQFDRSAPWPRGRRSMTSKRRFPSSVAVTMGRSICPAPEANIFRPARWCRP